MDNDCRTRGQSVKQKFDLRFDRVTEAGPVREFYKPRILVDGVPIPEKLPVDLWRLVRSLNESGPHALFCCGCGDAGCGGVLDGVEVSHFNTDIEWRYRIPQSSDGFDGDEPYEVWLAGSTEVRHTFDRRQALWAVFEALSEVDQTHGEGAEYPLQGFERHHIGELFRRVEEIFRGQPLNLKNLPFDPATAVARWAELNESETKGNEKWGK